MRKISISVLEDLRIPWYRYLLDITTIDVCDHNSDKKKYDNEYPPRRNYNQILYKRFAVIVRMPVRERDALKRTSDLTLTFTMCELKFYEQINFLLSGKNSNSVYLSRSKYDTVLQEIKRLKSGVKLKPNDYKLIKRFDITTKGNVEKLIFPVTEPNTIKYYVYNEELYDIIHAAHLLTGHGGRNKLEHSLSLKYKNITRECIMIYLNLCESCQKKGGTVKKGAVVDPGVSLETNSCCQFELIDKQAQPDGDYKFILVYHDILTNYILLKPLIQKCEEEVAHTLLDIFTTFGAPLIIQSENEEKFVDLVINKLCNMWHDLKIVNGKPLHSQSHESVERSNQDIENMLATWLTNNKTNKWSNGLKFIQFMKNKRYHHRIKCSPYEAMFGSKTKQGLKSTSLPENVLLQPKSEDNQEALKSIPLIKENINEENEKKSDDKKLEVICDTF